MRYPARGVSIAGVAFLMALSLTAGGSQDTKSAWPPPVQRVRMESPALSPADSMKTFHMPSGYRVELVASEPMVVDPVAIDFDPDGRLYVVEMLGFMPDTSGTDSREPVGRIAVLEDNDDDGKMDRRTVFLDRLVLPRAVKVLDRGVLVAEPPNLWLARDTNGDLRADTKELVRDDYGRRDGNPEHNANGLHWGLDNWIYTSEHDYHLQLVGDKFLAHPTLNRGQWGLSMDDGGRLYRNWNEQPLFVDAVPARYYMRNPNLVRTRGVYEMLMDPKEMTVWPVRPTRGVNRGYREGVLRDDGTIATYVSAGTPTIYRGDRLPRELYGNAFVTESAGNLVHRLEVIDSGDGRLGARNAYDRGEFLAATDERFRPVNLFSAPDGTLLVVDMYRGVIQDGQYWTDYLREYIKANNLEIPVGLGRIYRIVHETTRRRPKPSLSRATPAELVHALEDANGWHRETGHRLLVERGDVSAVPALKALAMPSSDPRARLHALWVLDGLHATELRILKAALQDSSADVRASAIRLSEPWLRSGNDDVARAMLARVDDENWIVRRQLAASLGELPTNRRVDALVTLLRRYGHDAVVVDAAVSGLAGMEAETLNMLNPGSHDKALADAVAMLAGAITKSRQITAIERLLDTAADDAHRPAWQRLALLQGMELGMGGSSVRTGRGRSRNVGPMISLRREPMAFSVLERETGELGNAAKRIRERVTWPGKPAPVVPVVPLTTAEQQRFAQGQEVYRNLCVACHQIDGLGREKMAPSLISSPFTVGDPSLAIRIVLAGKEGKTGLMPPLGTTLSDDSVAAVLTYIRREWGHTASPVTAAEVREVRGMTASRRRPWTDEELTRLAARSQ